MTLLVFGLRTEIGLNLEVPQSPMGLFLFNLFKIFLGLLRNATFVIMPMTTLSMLVEKT